MYVCVRQQPINQQRQTWLWQTQPTTATHHQQAITNNTPPTGRLVLSLGTSGREIHQTNQLKQLLLELLLHTTYMQPPPIHLLLKVSHPTYIIVLSPCCALPFGSCGCCTAVDLVSPYLAAAAVVVYCIVVAAVRPGPERVPLETNGTANNGAALAAERNELNRCGCGLLCVL